MFFQILGSFVLIFVLVTIIIFELALHICIFIIYKEHCSLVMAGLKEKFHTLILKFTYTTFCLLPKPDSVAAKDFDGIDTILL